MGIASRKSSMDKLNILITRLDRLNNRNPNLRKNMLAFGTMFSLQPRQKHRLPFPPIHYSFTSFAPHHLANSNTTGADPGNDSYSFPVARRHYLTARVTMRFPMRSPCLGQEVFRSRWQFHSRLRLGCIVTPGSRGQTLS